MNRGPGSLYRKLQSLRFLAVRDRQAVLRVLSHRHSEASTRTKLRLLWSFIHITNHIRAYHTQAELLTVADAILRRPRREGLCVVEAGTGKGASTAKLSLALRAAGGGTLHVFDSFRGLPENNEVHQNIDGREVRFRKGAFTGRLNSVQRTVEKYGAPELCIYYKGWFEETMPAFKAKVDVALLDVDLLSSTETCLKYIYPQLAPDGVVFSQDGHLRAIVDRLGQADFWRDEVGVSPPEIRGLGTEKFLTIPAGLALVGDKSTALRQKEEGDTGRMLA